MSRIDDVPYYEQRPDQISATLYNLWRRTRLHFELPLRIPLPAFSGMVWVLEEAQWVCVDERQNDLPILAWVEFEDKGRSALHTPVQCKLNYYHFAASKIRAGALACLESTLEKELKKSGKENDSLLKE